MRRQDREITDFDDIVDVFRRSDTVRIGLFGAEYPYVVPLSFGFEVVEGKIVLYIHGASDGFKHDLIARNNKVCAEVDIFHGYALSERGITTKYESAIGFGYAEKVFGDEAMRGMELLLARCGFDGFEYDREAPTGGLTVYKIVLESVSCKSNK
jgi:Predicted flavin-nucleotide-binding protein